MRDPFHITGPAVISFSGGRTSGYMLWRIIQSYGGTLPEDVKVIFCNTGKERTETLDFVERCSQRWEVPITWLEYRNTGEGRTPSKVGGHSFAVVDYHTASRSGEPFDAVISAFSDFRDGNGKDPVLPNAAQRFCTVEMKIRTCARYIDSLGWEDGWPNAIGIRSDEPQRVARARASSNRWDVVLPLADAGINEADVMGFWSDQEFDLELGQFEGNCDLCFLKSRGKLERIIRDRPDLADWWINAEVRTGQKFRRDRPGYAALLEQSQRPTLFSLDEPDELSIACHCTD